MYMPNSPFPLFILCSISYWTHRRLAVLLPIRTAVTVVLSNALPMRVLMAESLGFVASQSEASIHSGVMLSLNCELLRTTGPLDVAFVVEAEKGSMGQRISFQGRLLVPRQPCGFGTIGEAGAFGEDMDGVTARGLGGGGGGKGATDVVLGAWLGTFTVMLVCGSGPRG